MSLREKSITSIDKTVDECEVLDAERQKQPIAELERKWEKAQGRHSNRYWCQEWLDLAKAMASEMYAGINWQ